MLKLCIRYSTAIICCVLFLTPITTYGQTVSDTLQLDEIEVKATRIYQPRNYQPTNVEVIDSVQLEMLKTLSVAEVLASQSSLMIKDYGPGGMATASQRGLSSEQIQVLWEGIPINSPMQGQADLSLLPASFFSNVQVSSGTPSTAFGGGSLSGALYLGSDWKQTNYVSTHQSIGSFGQWQSSVQGKYNADGVLVSVRGLYDYGDNDYEYFSRAYNRVEKRKHNRSKRYSVMSSVGQNRDSDQWKTTFWLSDSKNQIPGDILSTNPKARQNDKSLRWLSSYDKNWGDTELAFKNYLEKIKLNYFDPGNGTRSLSTTKRWMVSSTAIHSVGEHLLLKGEVSGELTSVETNNYKDIKNRQQFSVLTNPELTLDSQRLRIYPSLRVDMYSDFGTVLSPSLGANYELFADRLFLRGQLSRDFNAPSFNALYWGDAGDPNLKPERSNSAELGVSLSQTQFVGITSLDITGYYSKVDNGIRWYPNNSGQWAPSNVEQVTTKGIEAHLTNTFLYEGPWLLTIDQKGIMTSTEISEARFRGDQGVGNQVRLVPKWKYNASLTLQRGIATAVLKYRWISRRYLTETEAVSNSLDPYQVIDAHLQLKKTYQNFNLKVLAAAKNILGENYEIISWYPMPKRNYNFSITATYKF
ncbi:TonB-dependent receptor plug domain-containing protein [Fodinibius halophilus]|uniref:TonB-dependent receptor n=1 Tax=Fodinibius halophilus TaxID=1736908 RepID=A0A6M1T2J7_9BACT|nr:TonB-dependent receptor [Fodinibius halophilus]NGP86843.1 TonB-dependent receptor [Fodinibius halophilus]